MEPSLDLPPITITSRDHERLEQIASAYTGNAPEGGLSLAEELERARIVDTSSVPREVVTMNTCVEFYFDGGDADRRVVTLVYPGEQDITKGKISVHTPVGIALLGMSEGQSIECMVRPDTLKRLTVTKVIHQPEAAGEASC